MADNITLNAGTGGPLAATDEVSYSGDTAQVQLVRVVSVSGTEGSKTVSDAPGLTDTQLRAAAVPVSGTFFQATQPVSASSLPLPTGAASESTLAARLPVNGQAAMAASVPVTLASDQGPISILEPATFVTGAAAQTTLNNNVLLATAGAGSTDVGNFRSATVQVVSTGTAGAFVFEQSADGANWRPLPVFNSELVTAVPIVAAITATVSQIVYTLPIRARFVRLRISTAITGGSIQAFSKFSTEPWTPTVASVAQATAANMQTTVTGTVTANIGTGALAAGTNAIGDVGLQVRANATGAATNHHIVSAATTNVAQIKATAGRVMGWCLSNTTASWRFVKLHNVASATAGAAVAQTIGIPPNDNAVGSLPTGVAFTTAISRSIVTGSADNDTTATAVGDVVGDIFFA